MHLGTLSGNLSTKSQFNSLISAPHYQVISRGAARSLQTSSLLLRSLCTFIKADLGCTLAKLTYDIYLRLPQLTITQQSCDVPTQYHDATNICDSTLTVLLHGIFTEMLMMKGFVKKREVGSKHANPNWLILIKPEID